jgi:hypothetical protein
MRDYALGEGDHDATIHDELTDEGAPFKCKMQSGRWDYSAGFRPRSFFSSGGFVDGTDEAGN